MIVINRNVFTVKYDSFYSSKIAETYRKLGHLLDSFIHSIK